QQISRVLEKLAQLCVLLRRNSIGLVVWRPCPTDADDGRNRVRPRRMDHVLQGADNSCHRGIWDARAEIGDNIGRWSDGGRNRNIEQWLGIVGSERIRSE